MIVCACIKLDGFPALSTLKEPRSLSRARTYREKWKIKSGVLATRSIGPLAVTCLVAGQLAAAIGAPKAVNVTNHKPPRRRKKGPGPRSPHKYKVPSFKEEYSFTYN